MDREGCSNLQIISIFVILKVYTRLAFVQLHLLLLKIVIYCTFEQQLKIYIDRLQRARAIHYLKQQFSAFYIFSQEGDCRSNAGAMNSNIEATFLGKIRSILILPPQEQNGLIGTQNGVPQLALREEDSRNRDRTWELPWNKLKRTKPSPEVQFLAQRP